MKKLPFKSSAKLSLGVELEFQIINPITYDLSSQAKDLIRHIKESVFQDSIKPEITQGMIEINSSIHHTTQSLLEELLNIRSFLLEKGENIGVMFSGGGTHPFEKWSLQKIFPAKRFKSLSRQYRYLSKRSTVFGQHVHIGCESAENALYLTHALARYVPQLIAISASSPLYQGIDTGYFSSRSNIFNAFPTSGVIPYLTTWREFSEYFYKMRNLKIIKSMKDFYWDIRPKPEFGTVEVRVCDTPLTIEKAVMIAAYIQSLSAYLLQKKPVKITHDLYDLYSYNRFQALRYGFEGNFINPETFKPCLIYDDILETLKIIKQHSETLGNYELIIELSAQILKKQNDTVLVKKILKELKSLPLVVNEQCKLWAGIKDML
ncbi:MAG: YbdK family carboxylate-amine ligase [Gammaproteobacteria bacterium]